MTKFGNYDLQGQLPVLAWNPIVMRCPGCELSTPDAKGWIPCWHLRMANRMMHNPTIPVAHRDVYAGNAPMRLHPKHMDQPFALRKPRVIATQFMGDLGQAVIECQQAVFSTMLGQPSHTFLVLTKWPEKIKADVPDNCWIGTTITDQATADLRMPKLMEVKAKHKWVSVEPMRGPVVLWRWITKLGFVACGPETGRGACACDAKWISVVASECRQRDVPFYDKRDPGCFRFQLREWPEEWMAKEGGR